MFRLDCSRHSDICKAYDFHKFPSFVAFLSGEKIGEYDGSDRSFETLLAEANKFKSVLKFTSELATYVDGYDVESDFFTNSETPEAACRAHYIEKAECVAYSVKIEEPLAGQCYLKRGPLNTLSKIATPSYNSGIIYQ